MYLVYFDTALYKVSNKCTKFRRLITIVTCRNFNEEILLNIYTQSIENDYLCDTNFRTCYKEGKVRKFYSHRCELH